MAHDPTVLSAIAESELSEVERALAVLYTQDDYLQAMTVAEIATVIEQVGHATINRSRLGVRLAKDKRCSKISGGFRIRANQREQVAKLSARLLGPKKPRVRVSWLDPELVKNAPRYVGEIVDQINATYQMDCFDACSVMVRRLTETMLIETFEQQGALQEIVDANGELVSLKHLIERAKQTSAFTLSRQTKNALPALKDVGDWSAHNRRYLAKRSDLDRVQQSCRVSLADLGHLAGMQ